MKIIEKKKIETKVLIAMISSIGMCFLFCSESVFAYSLNISTSGETVINVVPPTNGGINTTVVADNVGIVSDCRAGYSFIITGPSDNNLYLNGDDLNNVSGTFFSTVNGVEALNNENNANKWGYSLTANSGTGIFNALSNDSVTLKTPAQTASPDSDINSVVPIYYGVSVNFDMPVGSYTFKGGGSISYQVVMNASCMPGIHYEPNGADGGLGTMDVQDVAAGDNAYLIAPNYSREGYGFASWNTSPDGTGTNYGPNEYITMPESGSLVLYANWVESIGDLQGWTGCSSLSINDVVGLTDTRDGNVYAVAKLADGKCWMVENMRLDVGEADITVLNTNNPTAKFLEEAKTVTANNGEWCVRSSSPINDPCENALNYNTKNSNRNLDASYNVNGVTDVSWYSYGAMYNHYTATAGAGRYGSGRSICPTGWRLPTGSTRSNASLTHDYHGLMHAWNSNYDPLAAGGSYGVAIGFALAYPNNFIASGTYRITQFRGRGIIGNSSDTGYWGQGGYLYQYGNAFQLNNTRVSVGDGANYGGYNVRCVDEDTSAIFTLNYNNNGGETIIPSVTANANKVYAFKISNTVPQRSGYSFKYWIDKDGNEYNPGDDFTTIDVNSTLYAIWENNACNPDAETISQAVCLQDMNDAVKSTMISKQTYTLKDSRDNKQYNISLLDDGLVWMTKNLDVGLNSEMALSSSDTDIVDNHLILPAQVNTFTIDNSYYSSDYTVMQLKVGTQYGGYYSWPAAIARKSYEETNQNVTTSICPSGWDLPLSGHYDVLIAKAGINNSSLAGASPYNFALSGYITSSGGATNAGAYGAFWASNSSNDVKHAYYAIMQSGNFATQSGSRHSGYSIRCIYSSGFGTINYNANGGSGEMNSMIDVELNSTTIDGNGFIEANEHKQFREWNTHADGSGIAVKPGDVASVIKDVLVDGEVTLYAQWDDLYILTFHNTETGESAITKVVAGKLANAPMSASDWDNNREYYELIGWDTNPNGQNAVYRRNLSSVPTSDLDLYSVWGPLYVVTFDGNGADSGNRDSTNKLSAGNSIQIGIGNFAKTGYGFAGWSLNSAAVPGDGISTIYGPEEWFVVPSGLPAGEVTLYAVWVEADNNYTMQSFGTSEICDTLSIGDVIGLSDTRDSNTYAVAKLASGDCWMMENLRLDPTQATINVQNTDAPTISFINDLAGYPSQYDGCNDDTDSNCVNSVGFDVSDKSEEGMSYNWYTATAGNGTYSVVDGEVAIGSICPNGWHLPRTSYWYTYISGEVDTLRDGIDWYGDYGRGALYPNNLLSSYYWTSNTAYSDALGFSGEDDYPSDYEFGKSSYQHARCVADKKYTIEFSNNNSSSGSMNNIENVRIGDTVILPSSGYVYDGQLIFVGWSLEEYDVAGDYDPNMVYSVGTSINIDRNVRARIPADENIIFYPVFDYDPNF